jgi:hypothetical protein
MCSVTDDVQRSPLALQNFVVMIALELRVESKTSHYTHYAVSFVVTLSLLYSLHFDNGC